MTEVSPCDNEFISTVFLVPKKTGDFQPVINLKPLNQFVKKIHFKMESIHMALNCISPWGLHGPYLRTRILVYLSSSLIVDTYVFSGISSVMSLLAYPLVTALHPGFSLRSLSPLLHILDFLVSGLLFSLMISYLLQALMVSVYSNLRS